MKIFYASCHSVLEADEIKILSELGHYVFSPGAYVEKENPGDASLRPKTQIAPEFADRYAEDMELFHACGKPGVDNKENLSVELLKRFDAVIVMHIPKWITANWQRFKKAGVQVVWRTIGQSWRANEDELRQCRREGMKIVRYSPREDKIPNNLGGDLLIRFYKDPDEFGGWTGEDASVFAVVQSILKRREPCNYAWLDEVSQPFPRSIYGAESEQISWGKGKLSFEDLRAKMRSARVGLNGGTYPASITLSAIEQWMTGTPLVCVGPAKGHPFPWFNDHPLYEWGDLIENGVNGMCSDNLTEAQDFIRHLLNDHDFAKKVSAAGRASAIKIFGKEPIKQQWKMFLDSLK